MTKYPETPVIGKKNRIINQWKDAIQAFQVGTDQLWPVIIFACFLFLTSLIPLIPHDFWWHLKIGEIIFLERSIPSTNMFAWSIPGDHPFTYAAWLADYLFYLFYRIGKLEILLFLRTLLAGILFGLLAFESKRRSGSWRMAAFAVALAWLMIFNNLAVRPQVWSWLPFMAYFVILSRYVDRQLSKNWLFILPLCMVFWVNAHGAFILGIFLIGSFLVGETLTRLLKLPRAISWGDIRWLALSGLLTLFATIINPQSFHIAKYVISLMTDPSSQALIEEWRSPTPQGISNIIFFLSIMLLIIGLAYSVYRPRASEIILIVGLLWLAWSGQRYVIWYALVVTPILAQLLSSLRVNLQPWKAKKNWLNLALAMIIFLPVILVQPWFVENFPLPKNYWNAVQYDSPMGPLLSWKNPVEAANYLQANPGGNLFNEMGYGSYLIWAMPVKSVFIDPRVEIYPYEQWQDYLYISHGVRYNQLLEQYGARRILLDKEIQPELAKALASDPTWDKEYEDQHAQIWRKK